MAKNSTIKQRFKSSIKRGTGGAYLLMKNYPGIDFSDSIIMASLKDFAYDGQCEGSRGSYLFGLISQSEQQDKIRNAILTGLATEQEDTWSLVQLFDLARIYALNGDTEAKQAMYDRFYTKIISGADWIGYDEILELDGIKGLLYVAEKIGRSLKNNPDDWQDGAMIGNLQQKVHKVNLMEVLEAASLNNHYIKIYLDNVKRTEANSMKLKREIIIYQNVVEEVLSYKRRFQFLKKKFTDDELNLIAQQFIIETNQTNREKLLTVFEKNKFPLDSRIILDLAKQQSRSSRKIALIAIQVLELLKSEQIREYAVEQIRTSKNPEKFVGILKTNYKTGDDKILTDLALRLKSDVKIEALMHSYIAIYRENETKECKEPLEALYTKSNCSIHREDIINILINNDVLSEKKRQN